MGEVPALGRLGQVDHVVVPGKGLTRGHLVEEAVDLDAGLGALARGVDIHELDLLARGGRSGSSRGRSGRTRSPRTRGRGGGGRP